VPAETRTVEEIRAEIAGERAQLEDALEELRRGVDAKRKPASVVAGVLVLVLMALVVRRVVQGLRGE
jgi:hypothetical protein